MENGSERLQTEDEENSKIEETTSSKVIKPSAVHCAKWLQETDFSATETESIADTESIVDTESTVDTESIPDSEISEDFILKRNLSKLILQKREQNVTDLVPMSSNNVNTKVDASGNIFRNISVDNSDNVYLGNVTNINIYKVKSNEKKKKEVPSIELEESISDNIFIKARMSESRPLLIIPRRRWLAQKAIEFEEFAEIPKFVIICHTATESGATMQENVSLIRDIQCLHIESRKWSDIGYNFLIGEDGNVYEGRGWKRIGAHTFGVNKYSLGIAFVGCYMAEEAPSEAIFALATLLDYGVKEKYIAPDYQLVGHCQFQPFNSPGASLYEVIKKHPNWEPNPVRPS